MYSRIQEDGNFKIRVAPGRNYIYLRPHSSEWSRGSGQYVDVGAGQTVKIEFKVQKSPRRRDPQAGRFNYFKRRGTALLAM